MCGIAGFLESRPLSPAAVAVGERMASAIARRGPDDHGVWCDATAGIVLAHRRLSVLDLSPAGHQPMTSPSGRYVIAYNGEIYNHLELRDSLQRSGRAPSWRGHSDTETLLAMIDANGLDDTLRLSVGMFAIALWDRTERRLTLVRDRMGEKPLYYGWQRGTLLFGSEPAALRVHPAFEHRIDRTALARYIDCGYVTGPESIYAGLRRLPPGTLIEVDGDRIDQGPGAARLRAYWSLADLARRAAADPFDGSMDDAADRLGELLQATLSGQMLADVPLGAFLSGGIDSSLVVAQMQGLSRRPVRTFSVGFQEARFDESPFARRIAEHLGTEHTELIVTADDALALVPTLPDVYSEPLADSSQIPTFLVAKLARQHVTVALSGDGGDELFCGYSRYFLSHSLWRLISRIPRPARSALARAVSSASPATWTTLSRAVQRLLPSQFQRPLLGDDLHKGRRFLAASTPMDLYRSLLSFVPPGEQVVPDESIASLAGPGSADQGPGDFFSQAMMLDSTTYLPDDILVKVDRAAMGVSLETRVPLLDHRIVEFAWSLPSTLKATESRGKLPMRRLLSRYVPERLTERPKMGFSVPIDEWLRGPLRPWADDLLERSRLLSQGYFDAAIVQRKWREHLGGQRNWQYLLWSILMFQAWLERNERDDSDAGTVH
ncbi:MAG TPA: asparagine synthase (glutamine-hydrolyzing) [Burkholderiaceae bacterium]|nr:asparagine synthase (glutamine-hydrolyzing) [Burkholderiaceae bacterium]